MVFLQLYVDGKLVIDNWTRQRRGEAFFGCGSEEEKGIVELKAGVKHAIYVEFCNVRAPADGDEDEAIMDRYISVVTYLVQLWLNHSAVTLVSVLAVLRFKILMSL